MFYKSLTGIWHKFSQTHSGVMKQLTYQVVVLSIWIEKKVFLFPFQGGVFAHNSQGTCPISNRAQDHHT